MIRINKYLANMGLCSRRKADEYILCGSVRIGNRVANHGDKIDPERDTIKFRGKIVTNKNVKYEYWVLYKPIGVVSTSFDEKGRTNVTNLVHSDKRLYPVGRLDTDSEGLIVLTNDGNFANKLMHPSNNHIKTYQVIVSFVYKSHVKWIKSQLEKGIEIDNKTMKAEKVLKIETIHNNKLVIDMQLITGYNRQIRKMCDKIGLKVEKLTRTGIGKFILGQQKLSPGESKKINIEDII